MARAGRPRRSQSSTASAAGQPVGHRAFLVALAEHPEGPAVRVEVVHVHAGQLADPDTGGVEQLHHGAVAQGQRLPLGRGGFGVVHEPPDLLLVQDTGQGLLPLRRLEPQGGVGFDQLLADGPGGEGPGGGGAAGQGGAGLAGLALGAEPAPQGPELQPGKVLDPLGGGVRQQAFDVGEIGPHGMGGPAPLRFQVAAEACGGKLHGGRQRGGEDPV